MKRTFWALALVMCIIYAGCQKEIAVESVTLNPTSLSLTEGESATVSATISPSDATNQKVLWTTSNQSVANVENGLVIALSAGSATVTAISDDGGKTATCEVTVKAKVIEVTGVSLDKTTLELEEGSTGTLSFTVAPSNATDKSVCWTSSDESVATVSAEGVVSALKAGKTTVTVTTVDQGKTASCEVIVTPAVPLVDLGLSVKWAAYNLGASNPEEYGGYYQWGGLEDVADTSIDLYWGNCPHHTGSNSNTGWTKYVSSDKSSYWSGSGRPDDKTVLDPEDDVAHVKLGGKWRMPTKAEFEELINNCQCEWMTYKGVDGRKFTSKKSGYADKWIFLPAAGYRSGNNLRFAGVDGCYWSSLLRTSTPSGASRVDFSSDILGMGFSDRSMGLSVRPVSE